MPEPRQPVTLGRHYDANEYEHLAQGEVPADQDDRWFIWVGDDHVVHVHRSWTGFELWAVRLHPSDDEDGYEVAEAWANPDPAQYQRDLPMEDATLGPLLDRLAGRQ